MKFLEKVLELFKDTFFVRRCACCESSLYADDFCDLCDVSIIAADSKMALFAYGGSLKDTIQSCKFAPSLLQARALSELITLKRLQAKKGRLDYHAVTYVPIHWRRKLKRGFDLPKLLAEKVAKELDLPCLSMLQCIRFEKPMTLQIEDRKSLVRGKFCFRYSKKQQRLKTQVGVDKLRVLLVDDVLTTGATLNEAESILLKNQVKVRVLAFSKVE